MDGPMLRAWMPEAVRPAPDYAERPGRWIAEAAVPVTSTTTLELALDTTGLTPEPSGGEAPREGGPLCHGSGLTVGLDAGAWCAYAAPADMPLDQRRDDALSLSLDSEPLAERLEIFGKAEVRLRVAVDRPVAFAMARLCDVWPDGSSTMIARGVLNLCHRAGHDRPQPLTPGEPVDVTISMKSVGYAVPAGHRLRLAISTSYWPWLWPSPEPVTLSIFTGGTSVLRVPVRAPQDADGAVPAFGPAEQAPPLEVTWRRARNPTQTVHVDQASGETRYLLMRDFSGARRHPNGLEYGDYDPVTLTIREGDPLSARVTVERNIEQRRGDWCVRIEVRSEMTADAADYLVSTSIDAYEGDTRVHTRTHVARVPRDHS
jgi:hypothetical protein